MSERTGATDEQLDAAIIRRATEWWMGAGGTGVPPEAFTVSLLNRGEQVLLSADDWARYLVPEGMVIVPERAVPDQAVIAAIRGLERRYAEWQQGSRDPEAEIVNAWLDEQEDRDGK